MKVDRTAPNVTLGGSLSDGAASDPTDPEPELTVTADDPAVNGSASGVASAELFVDGVATNTQEQQDLQRIATDQCTDAECRFVGVVAPSTDGGDAPDADTVSLDTSTLTPGAHNLRLVVTDKAGNRRQSDWVHRSTRRRLASHPRIRGMAWVRWRMGLMIPVRGVSCSLHLRHWIWLRRWALFPAGRPPTATRQPVISRH